MSSNKSYVVYKAFSPSSHSVYFGFCAGDGTTNIRKKFSKNANNSAGNRQTKTFVESCGGLDNVFFEVISVCSDASSATITRNTLRDDVESIYRATGRKLSLDDEMFEVNDAVDINIRKVIIEKFNKFKSFVGGLLR